MQSSLIFGGTFDPIHKGHINTVINVQNHLLFDEVIFLPCKTPLLKDAAKACAKQRVDMLNIALNDFPEHPFTIDTCEITRNSPSFMVTTLEDYRERLNYHDASLTLLIGMDTFLQLPKWHQWKNILSLANLLIINRPGTYPLTPTLDDVLKAHETVKKEELTRSTHGLIYRFDAGHYDVSSTNIRQSIQEHSSCNSMLTDGVIHYIQHHQLYGLQKIN